MILNLVISSTSAIFFAMRTYTLHNRNKAILAVTLLLCLSTSIIHAIAYFLVEQAVYYDRILTGFESGLFPHFAQYCANKSKSRELYNMLMTASRVTSIVADTLVLVLTLRRAMWCRRKAGISVDMQSLTMLDFVVRYGVLYFSVALLMNLIGLFLSALADYPNGALIWIYVLPSILMNRFIIDLRETYSASPHSGDEDRVSGVDSHGFMLTSDDGIATTFPQRECAGCMEHHPMDTFCHSLRNVTPEGLGIDLL